MIRYSSLDGLHTEADVPMLLLQRVEPVTVALSSKEIRVIKCNGVSPGQGSQKHMYTLPSDYLSHIVVLGTQVCMYNNTMYVNWYVYHSHVHWAGFVV